MPNTPRRFHFYLVSSFAAVFLIWALYLLWALSPPTGGPESLSLPDGTLASRGLFGDAFGAINALFSGLALAAVAVSLLIQQRDLQATLNELKGQKDAMEMQSFISAIATLTDLVELSKVSGLDRTISEPVQSALFRDVPDLAEKLRRIVDSYEPTS